MDIALVLAGWICCAGPAPIVEASALPVAKQWQALEATPRMRVGNRSTGTAVVVGREKNFLYLLTADHATDGPDTTVLTFEFFAETDRTTPSLTLRGAKAIVRRPVADFALLQVAVEQKQNVTKLSLAPPKPNLNRYTFEAYSIGCSLTDPPTGLIETVLAKRLALRSEDAVAFFWQTEKPQARGRSGGPLLNTAGQIIGICAATSAEKGYYVHLSEVHAALKAEGYAWLWTGDSAKSK